MKVIDLLNKIANGEELPKKISINAGIHGIDTWVYDEHYEDYENGANVMLLDSGMITNHLNDEVEIIEEDKKIKRIQSCGDNLYSEYIGQWLVNKENYTEYDELLMNKINEIIDYINGGIDEDIRN